jgi:hypothetical protein
VILVCAVDAQVEVDRADVLAERVVFAIKEIVRSEAAGPRFLRAVKSSSHLGRKYFELSKV